MKTTAEFGQIGARALERTPDPFASVEVPRVRRSPQRPTRKRVRGKILFVGGLLALVGAGFILAAPQLGIGVAIAGTLLASLASAGVTLLARR